MKLAGRALLLLSGVGACTLMGGCAQEFRATEPTTWFGGCLVHSDCAAGVCLHGSCLPDRDHDYLADALDPCPDDPTNDYDQDGACNPPDACGASSGYDFDRDGICADADNCAAADNPAQVDADGDGRGDACDPCPSDRADDTDGDGVCDGADACPGGGCALLQSCSTQADCEPAGCVDSLCAPAGFVAVRPADGQPRTWVQSSEVSAAQLPFVERAPSERARLPLPVTWWESLRLANEWSQSLGLTPCYDLDTCSGDAVWQCPDWCVDRFRCESAALRPSCTGLRLPTLDEWTWLASTRPVPDVARADWGVGASEVCVNLSLFGGPPCAGPSAVGDSTELRHMHDNLSEWVWDSFVTGRSRREWRLAMGGSFRAIPVAYSELRSFAHRPGEIRDFTGARLVWNGGPP